MSKYKTLLVAVAVAIPSTANACDLHGGFGGMHFGNLSIFNAPSSAEYARERAANDHRSSQSVRYVRFGANRPSDDYEDESSSSSDSMEDNFDPDGPAVLR